MVTAEQSHPVLAASCRVSSPIAGTAADCCHDRRAGHPRRSPDDSATICRDSAGGFWDRLQSLPEDTEHADLGPRGRGVLASSHHPRRTAPCFARPRSAPPAVEPTRSRLRRSARRRRRPARPPAPVVPVAGSDPADPAPPAEAPPAAAPPTPARKRRRRGGFLTKALLLSGAARSAAFGLAWYRFAAIERVDTAGHAGHGGAGTNYLIVGSDSREGLDRRRPGHSPAPRTWEASEPTRCSSSAWTTPAPACSRFPATSG